MPAMPMDTPSVASADTSFGSPIVLPRTLVDKSYSQLNTPSPSNQRSAQAKMTAEVKSRR